MLYFHSDIGDKSRTGHTLRTADDHLSSNKTDLYSSHFYREFHLISLIELCHEKICFLHM